MVKIFEDSKIAVWGSRYINIPDARVKEDRDVNIVQIEPGFAGDYIVEIRGAKNEICKSAE